MDHNRLNSELELIILPTEQCNFRCFYCYEKFERGAISRPLLESIQKLAEKRIPELKRLKIAWFGGEPLLEWKLITHTTEKLKKLCDSYDTKFSSSITTNGYILKPDIANKLISAGTTGFQITLDAHKSIHDRLRVTRNGAPTFDTIFQNLSYVVGFKTCEVLIRLHYSPDTAHLLLDLLKERIEPLIEGTTAKVLIRPISPLGGPNNEQIEEVNDDFRRRVREQAREILKEDFILDNDPNKNEICYAAKPNAFVFRSDGKVVKCTVALDHPKNIIGSINNDGELKIDSKKLAPWVKPLIVEDLKACKCPVKSVLSQ